MTIFLDDLEQDASTVIIKSSDDLHLRGLQAFSTRPDKDWSLTDCLTRDRYFEQLGFKAILAV